MLTVTIAGVDRTGAIKSSSFRKTENLSQQVDTCAFEIAKYGSLTYVPEVGHEVVATRTVDSTTTTIFGGVIARVREKVQAAHKLVYQVECVDYSQYLKRQLVTERYENSTVGAIISDLIATYTTDGFTTAHVEGAQAIESIAFSRLSVAECLQKLADAINYVWYVDYDSDIHFFPRATETGPTLTDTSGNFIYDSLEITQDLSQVRNSILVQGGEATSAVTRTELDSGDGTRVQFALSNKFASLPAVVVGGVAKTVGVEFLDDDSLYQCMWNFNEKYLRFTAGNTPASGTNNISVTGYYLYPIVVKVPAPSSIAAYGEYAFAITDKSIKSQDEAISRALAELQSYQNALYEGSFRTYADGFRSGQVVNIVSAQRGKSIAVLIQSVRAAVRDPLATTLEYQVQFATMKSVGIIEYLQRQLRSREVIVDDEQTLLNYLPFEEAVGTSDALATPTKTSPPYVVGTMRMGYATMG